VGGALSVFAGKVIAPAPLNVSIYSFVENANRTGYIFTLLDTTNQSCEIIENNMFPDYHRGYIYILGKKLDTCIGATNDLPLIRLTYGFPSLYPPSYNLFSSVLDPNTTGAVFGKNGLPGSNAISFTYMEFGPRAKLWDIIYLFGRFSLTINGVTTYNILRLNITYDVAGNPVSQSIEHMGGSVFAGVGNVINSGFYDRHQRVLYIGGEFNGIKVNVPGVTTTLNYIGRALLDVDGRFATTGYTWIPDDQKGRISGDILTIFQNCEQLYIGGIQQQKGPFWAGTVSGRPLRLVRTTASASRRFVTRTVITASPTPVGILPILEIPLDVSAETAGHHTLRSAPLAIWSSNTKSEIRAFTSLAAASTDPRWVCRATS